MYSSRLTILLAIFTSEILIGIQATISKSSSSSVTANDNTNQYQPLYVVKKNNRYNFVDSATYKLVMNQQLQPNSEVSDDREQILAACSKTPTTDRLLEIMLVDEKQIVDGFHCNEPIEFFVKQISKTDSEHYLIGFMIYDDSGISSANNVLLSDIPTNNFPISLIKVALRRSLGKYESISIRHDIKYADMLSATEQLDQRLQDQAEYEKNLSVFGYDINAAYEPGNQSEYTNAFFKTESNFKLVKMQLAPIGDFFFDAWKRASMSNINTTPVWDTLISEWFQLEKFIRRVAEVVGDLQIITGGVDPYFISRPNTGRSIEFYESHYSVAALSVYETIFKTISFNQKRRDNRWIRQGIVFYMINDPRKRDDIWDTDILAEETGWKYLGDGNSTPRIMAKIMDADTLKLLGVTISYTYEPFNLNKFKKLSKNGQGEEIVVEVDVLREMMKKSNNSGDAPVGIEISED